MGRSTAAAGTIRALVVSLAATVALPAGAAEEPPRVVLIEDPTETTILPRLRAELGGLGLDVRTVTKNQNEQLPRDLIESARQSNAVAAFRIVVEGDRADVWIADRVTGKVVLREMLPRGAQIDGRVVALRAVELLRASLLELDGPRAAPQGELPPPLTLTENAKLLPELERFSLAAQSAWLWSPGGCGPGIGVAAEVAWRPSWLGVRLSGGSMLAPATITVSDGRGEVTTRWLALGATVEPRRARMPFRPRGGVAIAGLSTSLHGVTDLLLRTANQETVYTLSPMASFDVGWAVHSRVRLELGVAYLHPLHGVDILVAGSSVGSYGSDIFLVNLGLDILLP